MVPCPCVAPLWRGTDPAKPRHRDSGYRNVEPTHSDLFPWRARVKLGGKLREIGRTALPHQAAALVARWYREQFGPDWVEQGLRKRKCPKTWRLVYTPGRFWATYRVMRSATDGGWVLSVWEFGREVVVTEVRRRSGRRAVPRPGAKSGRVRAFASAADARAFVAVWLARRWGLFDFVAAARV